MVIENKKKLKVGITGQTGFIGTHLFNTLGLFPGKFERIEFNDDFFLDEIKLTGFVRKCDVIVHLAALNRHNDPEVIHQTNINLVQQIISSCESTQSKPHILFSSSTQEANSNMYGLSKREGFELFKAWALKWHACFTGFIIPNVFGPFGHPYYNSVVATFCHQLTHNELPNVQTDSQLSLIYVGDLVNKIIQKIIDRDDYKANTIDRCEITDTATIRVSELLLKLTGFKDHYFENGTIPDLNNVFDRNLFNTLVTYIDHDSFFPFKLKLNTDQRGSFVETIKLNSGGQVSFSTTKPGITRGNHFHIRKAERFAVIKGKAKIEFRRVGTSKKFIFELSGENPSFVDMPVWFTHNITNVGDDEVYTMFWINEFFNPDDPDTFFELV